MRLNIILAALAALLGYPCVATYLGESVEEFVDSDAIPMLFPGFSADPVMFIELKRRLPEERIQKEKLPPEQQYEGILFQRTAEGWVLGNQGTFHGLRLDPALVDRDIFEHVLDLRLDRETLVPQENVDDAFRTGNCLTPETGITIRCLGRPTAQDVPPPELAHLILGKSTRRDAEKESVDGYYVCNPAHPREVVVYEPKNGRWEPSFHPTVWADKRIHEFLVTEVESFYFKNALGSMGFRLRPPKTWEPIPAQCTVGSKPLDLETIGMLRQEDVDHLFQQFATVKADGFLREKIPEDEAGSEVELRAVLKDGTEYSLHIQPQRNPKSNMVEAVASNHPFKFQLADFWVGRYKRQDPKDLFHPR